MTDDWHIAAAHWNRVYHPPLLPGESEMALINGYLQQFATRQRAVQALVLGVTPAYLDLCWPPGVSLLAVDRSRSMIDRLWRGSPDQILCADWFNMALPAGSRNFLLCDGGLCLQPWPHAQQALVRVMAALMPPGGLAILRCFVLPRQGETLAQILQDLYAGTVRNLSELQLRLWMVLQPDRIQGTSNRQVHDVLAAEYVDREALLRLPGVTPDWLQECSVATGIRRFWFTDIGEIVGWLTADPGGFTVEELFVPPHALGAYCPSLVLRRI